MTEADKVNILLVDNRPLNLMVLKAALAPLQENLVEAQSGEEALALVAEQDFAVVLLDVMMPGMDGYETTKLIRERERTKHTPIILITAMYRDDADAFRGYSAGAVDFIMKPFQPEILRSKVSVFVDLFRKTEEVKRQAVLIAEIGQREIEAKLLQAQRHAQTESDRMDSEKRRIQAIVEHAPMGIARIDEDLALSELNDAFAKQFGLDPEPSVGKKFFSLVNCLPQPLQEAIMHNHPDQVRALKMMVTDRRGHIRERYCDIAIWPIANLNSEQFSSIILVLDVTESINLENQRKDFTGTLAHDLQTPIIASDRALSLILQKVNTTIAPDMFKLVTLLKRNNENLLHMIESLLDVYHYESGEEALYFDEVDMKLLVTTCIDELKPLADEQGLTIESSLPTDLRAIYADRIAIRRVVTNLIDNAIKYTPRGGTIEIRGRNNQQLVELEVCDNGIGIPDSDREHLFERFWHGSNRKTFKKSSGLGLFLCKRIMDSHRGTIECESEVGKMTVFRISLPHFRQDEGKTSKKASQTSPAI